MLYTQYRVCERFGITPPDCKENWDDMHFWAQAQLMAYEEIRQHEEMKILNAKAMSNG